MKRNGQTLKTVPDGAPRRMSDAKTSWRKMTAEQRHEFLTWARAEEQPMDPSIESAPTSAGHRIRRHTIPEVS